MSEQPVVTVQITDINSTQEWTTDPNMIEVQLSAALLDKAGKCVAFMQEVGVTSMILDDGAGYDFFEVADDDSKPVITGDDGTLYSSFEPEYSVAGCDVRINKSGEIRVIFPFKHTSDEMWCDVGMLEDLKLKLKPTPGNEDEAPRTRRPAWGPG